MRTSVLLQDAQTKLMTHNSFFKSVYMGPEKDFFNKRYALEDEVYNLKMKMFGERLKEIQSIIDNLETEYQKEKKRRKVFK
jgi:hypothetical protein